MPAVEFDTDGSARIYPSVLKSAAQILAGSSFSAASGLLALDQLSQSVLVFYVASAIALWSGAMAARALLRLIVGPMLVIRPDSIVDCCLWSGQIPWDEIREFEVRELRGDRYFDVLYLHPRDKAAFLQPARWHWRLIDAVWPSRLSNGLRLPGASIFFTPVPTPYIAWLIAERCPRLTGAPARFDLWQYEIRYRPPAALAALLHDRYGNDAAEFVADHLALARRKRSARLERRWQAVADQLAKP